ncbi:hypothetical protein D3854_08985 [Streptococcus mutans]|nr:hypothetical protein [Streptococcus mutans]NLQ42275.1 hypothetical protein [Streptococcus mutans]NLQ52332.1 hypothetical protein [Streptococcus mutans]NLQ55619.1 hypothetical protein [Streptococcus mutans]NLQ86737.1 hypothetical protein [Streptococcus mutans]
MTAFTISLMIGFYFLTPIFWTLFKPLVVLLILLLLGSLIFIVMIVEGLYYLWKCKEKELDY